MEDKLKVLIEGNSEDNRIRWAMEWKKQDKKVIGVISSFVPEEIILAAGMLPWRITGTWRENTPHAGGYRSDTSCAYCNHVLESVLSGELDFLDGVIYTDIDQDVLRLGDVLGYLQKLPFSYIMHIPYVDSELNYRFLTGEIRRLINKLEDFGRVKISEDSLRSSIDTYNKMRNLFSRIYELRKRETPPLSGAEVLGITTAAQVMPKEKFNQDLENLLPYIEKRKTTIKQVHPRVLVSSEMLDNPGYIRLVEEGCLVAMDDTDTGSRYFIQYVDTTLQDPAYSLAKRYISRFGAPRMASWDKQAEQIIKWVKEYNIDGIISLPLVWCYPQRFRLPFLGEKLQQAGIPNMSFEREYHLAGVGQLRTRIGAFLEMLTMQQTTDMSC